MRAKELAAALGFKRSGNQYVGCCVAHDDRNPSMIIFEGKTGAMQVRCLSGCDPLDIIAQLRARGLWAGSGRDDDIALGLEMLRKEPERVDPNRHHALAMRLWGQAEYIGQTARSYLAGRGLELPPQMSGTLVRYLEDCPREKSMAPALIVLMRNVHTFVQQAIQRIYLQNDITTRFAIKTGAMMLGPVGESAMMLSDTDEIFYGREPEEGPIVLHVAEGFETALALYQSGVRPIWALGSAGAIARFPVIDSVPELVICADNDENQVGLMAAVDCSDRWHQAGRKVRIKMPPDEGTDFADILWNRRNG